jgi:hypothetical protein
MLELRLLFVPTVTLPKLRLEVTASCPGVVPVPVKGMANDGLDASDVMVTLPLTLPLAAGVNVTVKVYFCPPVREKGRVSPLSEKPVPLAAACVTLTV